jgi:type II secretory pathway component PulC
MIRGLLIRHAFVVVDLTLSVLVVVVIGLIASKVMPWGAADGGGSQHPDNIGPIDPISIPHPGLLSDYDSLKRSRMFGDAGLAKGDSDPVDEAPVTVAQAPSTLKLWGVGTAAPRDPLAFAIIQNDRALPEDRVKTFFLDDEVMPGLALHEVFGDRVVLQNSRTRELQELALEDPMAAPPTAVGGLAARQAAMDGSRFRGPRSPSNATVIKREEAIQELMSYDMSTMVSSLSPEFHEDEDGNVTGITSDSFSSVPLAQRAGVQDGDVIQTVNGLPINSYDQIYSVSEKLQGQTTFRVGVLRDGKPQTITIRLE